MIKYDYQIGPKVDFEDEEMKRTDQWSVTAAVAKPITLQSAESWIDLGLFNSFTEAINAVSAHETQQSER